MEMEKQGSNQTHEPIPKGNEDGSQSEYPNGLWEDDPTQLPQKPRGSAVGTMGICANPI